MAARDMILSLRVQADTRRFTDPMAGLRRELSSATAAVGTLGLAARDMDQRLQGIGRRNELVRGFMGAKAAALQAREAVTSTAQSASRAFSALRDQQAEAQRLAAAGMKKQAAEAARAAKQLERDFKRAVGDAREAKLTVRVKDEELSRTRAEIQKTFPDGIAKARLQVKAETAQAEADVKRLLAIQNSLESPASRQKASPALTSAAPLNSPPSASNRTPVPRNTGAASGDFNQVNIARIVQADSARATLGVRAFADIRAETDRLKTAYKQLRDSGTASFRELQQAKEVLNTRTRALMGQVNGLADQYGKARSQAAQLYTVAVSLGAISFATGFVKSSIETAREMGRAERALTSISGSSARARDDLGFVREQAVGLGLELMPSVQGFTQLSAAAKGTRLEGAAVREIFTGLSEAGTALGSSTEARGRALNAVQQMISKGVVSAEELRQQLAEALPGAFQIAARAAGVGTAEFSKMLERGEVLAEDFLPRLGAQLRKEFGGAAAASAQSAEGSFARLQSAITDVQLQFANTGLLDSLAQAADRVALTLKDPEIAASIRAAGQHLGDMVNLLVSNAPLLIRIAEAYLGSKAGGAVGRAVGGVVGGALGVLTANPVGIAAGAAAGGVIGDTLGTVVGGLAGYNVAPLLAATADVARQAETGTERMRALDAQVKAVQASVAAVSVAPPSSETQRQLQSLDTLLKGLNAQRVNVQVQVYDEQLLSLEKEFNALQNRLNQGLEAGNITAAAQQLDALQKTIATTRAAQAAWMQSATVPADVKAAAAARPAVTEEVKKFRESLAEQNRQLELEIQLLDAGVSASDAEFRVRAKLGGALDSEIEKRLALNKAKAAVVSRREEDERIQAEAPAKAQAVVKQSIDNTDLRELLDLTQQAIAQGNVQYTQEQALFEIQQRRALLQAAELESEGKFAEAALLRSQAEGAAVQRQLQGLQSIQDKAKETAEQQRKTLDEFLATDSFASVAANIREALGSMGEPVFGLMDAFEQLGVIAQESADAMTAAGKDPIKQQQVYTKTLQSSLGVFGGMTKAASGFFKQGSGGYKVMNAASKAFYAAELAMSVLDAAKKMGLFGAVTAAKVAGDAAMTTSGATEAAASVAQSGIKATASGVAAAANQASSGDPYTAFARVAAMVALLAGIGVAIRGASGGSAPVASVGDTGTGTVLGDSGKASESIAKSIDTLGDYANENLLYTQAMLAQLEAINIGINGVGALLYQTSGNGLSTPYNLATSSMYGGPGNSSGGSRLDDALIKQRDFQEQADLLDPLYRFGGVNLNVGGVMNRKVTEFFAKGIFGKVTTAQIGSGLQFDAGQKLASAMTEGLATSFYAEIAVSSKSWFKKSSSLQSVTQAASSEISNQFTNVVRGLYGTVIAGVQALDGDMSQARDILNRFELGIDKINLQGLSSEDVQARITAVFSALGDRMATAIGSVFGNIKLSDFQAVGEGMLETLTRVAAGFEYAQSAADALGVTLVPLTNEFAGAKDVAAELLRASIVTAETQDGLVSGLGQLVDAYSGTAQELAEVTRELFDLRTLMREVSIAGSAMGQSLVAGAGGLDGLRSALEAYQDGYFTEAERAAASTVTLREEFRKLGLTLPANRAGYRSLVESIDSSSEAGQTLLGRVLALAGGFNDLQESLDSAGEAQRRLRATIDEARGAQALPEQQLSSLMAQFDSAFGLALSSSGPELEKQADTLNELIKPLLAQVTKVYATGERATELNDYVLGAAESVAQRLDGLMGVRAVAAQQATTPAFEVVSNVSVAQAQPAVITQQPAVQQASAALGLPDISGEITRLINAQRWEETLALLSRSADGIDALTSSVEAVRMSLDEPATAPQPGAQPERVEDRRMSFLAKPLMFSLPTGGRSKDDAELIEQLKESNRHLAALLRVQMASGKRLIEQGDELIEAVENIESNQRLEAQRT